MNELADLIHEEQCSRLRPCGYGKRGHAHDTYYRDRASAVYGKLEPEIGAANVLFAVRVIIDELMYLLTPGVLLSARAEPRGYCRAGTG